jgi:hypothetical protein
MVFHWKIELGIVWWGHLKGSFKPEAFHALLKTSNATPHKWGLELEDVHMNSGCGNVQGVKE